MSAAWDDIKATLPPGLDGALEPGGRENGVIPTNFHGLDFEIVDEFDLIVEHESGEECCIGLDGTVGWIVDKVLHAWLGETDFYNHLIISEGKVFWYNPEEDPERAHILVNVWDEKDWRQAQTRLDSRARLIAYRRVAQWVSSTLHFRAAHSRRYTITQVEKPNGEQIEFRIWDRESYLPVKIVTVHAFGRVDVRPAPDGEPDAIEFSPGGRPTGLSSESGEAIAALLDRIEADLAAG